MAKQTSGDKTLKAAVGLAVLGVALVIAALGSFVSITQPAKRTFSLVDHAGRAVTERDFRGKLMLVMFGYTYCPDVCPTGLSVMSDALDILGRDGDRVTPVFITIDPERDTPENLKDYVNNFHARLVGLTGSAEQVAAAAKAFNAGYRKIPSLSKDEEDAGDYYMAHSTAFYLTGPEGESLMTFSRKTDPEAMAKGIGKFLDPL